MRLQGRCESTNVGDRRGMSGAGKAGLGLGELIVVGIITMILGGNPLDVLQYAGQASMGPFYCSADQRMEWLNLGISTGDLRYWDTFSVRESEL